LEWLALQTLILGRSTRRPAAATVATVVGEYHVAELRASINDHGFFGGIKGERLIEGLLSGTIVSDSVVKACYCCW